MGNIRLPMQSFELKQALNLSETKCNTQMASTSRHGHYVSSRIHLGPC